MGTSDPSSLRMSVSGKKHPLLWTTMPLARYVPPGDTSRLYARSLAGTCRTESIAAVSNAVLIADKDAVARPQRGGDPKDSRRRRHRMFRGEPQDVTADGDLEIRVGSDLDHRLDLRRDDSPSEKESTESPGLDSRRRRGRRASGRRIPFQGSRLRRGREPRPA